ncbi:putative bifunctional diguanylate cyclase/phosphodiesterase [Polymorphospora rubra]|uniref:putative bifunctional diguanylate cyclase/phosphodiesterase n=1 Tax=Polymorphospora rubra TaxID=338584 RepID=UPI003F4D25DB
MHFPSGVEIAAVAGGLTAVLGTVLLVRSARRHAAASRRARLVLATGAGVTTASLVVGLIGLVAMAPEWSANREQRITLATVVAIGVVLGCVLFSVGLLRLPGLAGDTRTVARHLLDAVVVGAALWFVGWVLLSEPTRILGTATPTTCTAILLASVAVVTTVGVAVVGVLRTARPRRGLILTGSGIVTTVVGGLGVATGVCQTGTAMVLASTIAVSIGLLILAWAVRFPDTLGEPHGDVIRRGTAYAFLPMLGMAVSAVYHLLWEGRFTAPGIVAGIVEGFALVARQYVALLDVRAYAHRLAESEAHYRDLAYTDALTGLANRRGLLEDLRRVLRSDVPVVLLALDLDGFKYVNDMRGHDVGDAVLGDVGARLRQNLRPGDLAARLGGDEFAVLMHTGPAEAQRAADRLLGVLCKPYEPGDGTVFLSVSIGIARRTAGSDVPTLLRNADLALRYAKQRGKNRVEQYDIAYDQLLRRRTTLEHELRGAVDRGELHLVYQPVAEIPAVRPVGAEALLRWTHPRLGKVRPDEFIPLAEESGMIATLGSWVLHQACHQLALWRAAGHDVWVSVNVSPRELHAPEYVEQVAEALRAHRVPSQRLVLEVTEHTVATDLDELIKRLRALRAIGVRIALDDFGAGYSSLGQLRHLPIDILKIDHSLVAEQQSPAEGRSGRVFAPYVDVVMRLGHQLGLQVIAEGVTNQTEMTAVVEAGCRFGQGQLFGWGVPAEHLEALLETATSPGARAVPAVPRQIGGRADGGVGPAVNRTPDVEPVHPSHEVDQRNPTRGDQDVRSVDSAREMRQA